MHDSKLLGNNCFVYRRKNWSANFHNLQNQVPAHPHRLLTRNYPLIGFKLPLHLYASKVSFNWSAWLYQRYSLLLTTVMKSDK